MSWVGQTLKVTIEKPINGGAFLARHQGRVLFVTGVQVGEEVTVEVTEDKNKSFCTAVVVNQQRTHSCPAARLGAGCCDYSHLSPQQQLESKQLVAMEQFCKFAGICDGFDISPLESGHHQGWRCTSRVFTDEHGRPGVRQASSHSIITQALCEQIPAVAQDLLRETRLPAEHEIMVMVSDDDSVSLYSRPDSRRSSHRSAIQARRGRRQGSGEFWNHIGGTKHMNRTVLSRSWSLSPQAFWQPHRECATSLARHVQTLVQPWAGHPDHHLWDLYSGAGLFSHAALHAGFTGSITLVDTGRASLKAADKAFSAEENLMIVNSPVEQFVGANHAITPHVIIADPSRKGVGKAMTKLASHQAERIILLSCDVASGARDAKNLIDQGYSFVQGRIFDAFPGTHHSEIVTVFDREDLATTR